MRNNKKRGFTLVELLVVIAILAILATVSVVGYTSFITRASVSNDENVAAQLNKFMVALKADHTGDFYGEEIDETNIREVTALILKDSGLNELVPQSLDYGYNFYYDLETGEYVVMEDKKILNAGIHYLIDAFADEPSAYEVKLENCFTQGNRYFFVGTPSDNSRLAQIVNGFYNLDSDTDVKTLLDLASNFDSKLYAFVSNAVVVTDNCNYRISNNPTFVIFADGVKSVGTTTKQWNSTTSKFEDVTADKLATITGALTVPNSVQFLEGSSLNVGTSGTIVINKPASVVAGMAFESFSDTTIKLTDGNYTTKNAGTITYIGKPVLANDTVEYLLEYYNPANAFETAVEVVGNKQVFNTQENDGTKFAFVSWDLTSFDVSSLNIVGSIKPELPSSTRDSEIRWTISTTNLATINEATGEVTFTGTQPTADNCTFTVTGTVNGVSVPLNIKVVAVYGATVNIAGKDVSANSTHTLVFGNTIEGQNGTYTLATSNVQKTFTTSEISLNEDITISTDKVVVDGSAIKVAGDVTGTVEETVTIKYGSYTIATDKKLTLFDAGNLPFVIKHDNIKYVGNSNTLSASDFFDKKDSDWTIPDNVTLMVYEGASNTDLLDTDRATIPTDTSGSFYVSDDSIEGFNTTFKFTGTRTSGPAYLCLVIDGVIVSPDIPVEIVNGYNVRSATQTDIDWKSGTQSYVLLNKVSLWESGSKTNSANYIKIGTNQTLWGNLFELNIQNGYYKANDASAGIIGLWGTIRDTKIVGDTYGTFGVSVSDAYGASAVDAKNGSAELINCYISGCRSPLRLDTSVTVTNCVFFGGRYSNIDIVGAFTLTLNGTNYTVNQGYNGSVGVGIAAWFNDSTKSIVNNGTLKQYNFISNSNKSQLPVLNYLIAKVDIPSLFGGILDNTAYNSLKYYLETDTSKTNPYVNGAIVCLDYGATGNVSMEGLNDYLGEEQSINLCDDWVWNLSSSQLTSRGISSNNMPNKVWTPNPEKYDDLFKESQNTTYMDTFKPENYNLTWK